MRYFFNMLILTTQLSTKIVAHQFTLRASDAEILDNTHSVFFSLSVSRSLEMLRMQDCMSANHINLQRSLFRLTLAQNIEKPKKKMMLKMRGKKKKIVTTASAALAPTAMRYKLSVHFVQINNLLLESDSVFMI